jgi:hypothetical protein
MGAGVLALHAVCICTLTAECPSLQMLANVTNESPTNKIWQCPYEPCKIFSGQILVLTAST